MPQQRTKPAPTKFYRCPNCGASIVWYYYSCLLCGWQHPDKRTESAKT